MSKQKIINDFKKMQMPQAISWLEELRENFKDVIGEKDYVFFSDIIEVIRREYEDKVTKLDRWQEVKKTLTVSQKDNILKKYLTNEEKEKLINDLI